MNMQLAANRTARVCFQLLRFEIIVVISSLLIESWLARGLFKQRLKQHLGVTHSALPRARCHRTDD